MSSNYGYRFSPAGAAALGREGGNQSKNNISSPSNGAYREGTMPFGGYSGGQMQPPTGQKWGGSLQGAPNANRSGAPNPAGAPVAAPPIYAGGQPGYRTNPFSQTGGGSVHMPGGLRAQMQARGVGNAPGAPRTPPDYTTSGNQGFGTVPDGGLPGGGVSGRDQTLNDQIMSGEITPEQARQASSWYNTGAGQSRGGYDRWRQGQRGGGGDKGGVAGGGGGGGYNYGGAGA